MNPAMAAAIPNMSAAAFTSDTVVNVVLNVEVKILGRRKSDSNLAY
jgi:hypothetical protein